ncbi:MAG: 4-amino-4-deoxy-L-arabinose transferase [Betaproteobacteria bacterium]|nr:4-amino-4-deoxy-L-arabinose transferase [Betaproteobacteria bacterium]MDH4326010.1 4-amino-4-deoxy-L-arabinose transferase [Betaproteobacteria bacterium]MDH5210707.1 4-amino-4-deoxy-L-arabinose transferase [Betaproteobacteria bacterium]MDH5579435.1 4-amino-4-deoxy-L-arabinose transferase [Betaproteobacteria bacterium]
MNAVSFGLALVAILLGAAAQVLLKAGTNAVGRFEFAWENALPVGWQIATDPRILGGTGCYALSLVVWIMALSRADLSAVYPTISLGFALNALLAWWLLGETLSLQRIAGIAVIMVGVALVARS